LQTGRQSAPRYPRCVPQKKTKFTIRSLQLSGAEGILRGKVFFSSTAVNIYSCVSCGEKNNQNVSYSLFSRSRSKMSNIRSVVIADSRHAVDWSNGIFPPCWPIHPKDLQTPVFALAGPSVRFCISCCSTILSLSIQDYVWPSNLLGNMRSEIPAGRHPIPTPETTPRPVYFHLGSMMYCYWFLHLRTICSQRSTVYTGGTANTCSADVGILS